MAEPSMFDEVAAILPALVPEDFGRVRSLPRRWGIKVWFGPAKAPREHYEAQIHGKEADPKARVVCLEIGFHAEASKEEENDATVARVMAHRDEWKETIGDEAIAGDFIGGATRWRRISETWPDPDLSDPSLPFEVAARLVDYITAFEPVRQMDRAQPSRRQ